ncbi:WhiB family transcriptional regulator [Streptomyces sp. NPDC096048]|uniref:WhiB family transcriptional regulator n=1 Tax=Streptomyces sp. NPDC096048 TaxID=3366072 RepID=UPI0038085CCA
MTRIERASDWRDQALCATPAYCGVDFFPQPGDQQGAAEARTVCEGCPVRMACLRDALRQEGGSRAEYRHGIRGGLTAEERRTLYERVMQSRRRTRRARGESVERSVAECGTVSGYNKHRREETEPCEACLRAKAEYRRRYRPAPTQRRIAACGTRSGYQKHLRDKTEICAPCRRANTDADNRLRRTGTTKAVAR